VHGFDASAVSGLLRDFDWVLPARERPLALLLANGAELWPKFLQAYRSSTTLESSAHPLDEWLAQTVVQSLAPIKECIRIYFAHQRYNGRFLPMVSLAQAAGFAATAPCHLAVRHDVGPWLALRALVLLDAEAPAEVPPVTEPCSSCAAPCRLPFERALALTRTQSDAQVMDVAPQWQAWVAARDSCPYGRRARYSNDQIEYHYTRRRSVLG
jgi:hypothetical protein